MDAEVPVASAALANDGPAARAEPSPEVERLAARRAEARRRRDFAAADELKAAIQDAGWRVVDAGLDYRLERARPADVEVGGRVRYGSSASVPSALDDPATADATVVLPAGHDAGRVDAALAALRDAHPEAERVQMVVVADDVAAGAEERLDAWSRAAEVISLAGRQSLGAAWNAGLRRARGEVVLLLTPDARVTGDPVSPLRAALADATVAVAGTRGLGSSDVRRWTPADGPEADAIDAAAIGFRRAEAAAKGPLDERFATPRLLAAWWSLVLRDEGENAAARRAIVVPLPVSVSGPERPEHPAAPPERGERRDRYRLIDRFGHRYDLLRWPVRPTAASAKRRRR